MYAENATRVRIAYHRRAALTTMADTLVRTGGEATIETISTTGVHIRQRSERVPWWNSLHAQVSKLGAIRTIEQTRHALL